ncbi:MAG: hypothetical protein JJU02_08600 [Cryomorphaceae bacterium]|nr:hypothetical protein [Cryomorphaceae bacterium]
MFAQFETYSANRSKTLWPNGDSIVLDTLSVHPEYLELTTKSGRELDSAAFFFDLNKNTLWLSPEINDSVIVNYKTLPINLSEPFRKKPMQLFQESAIDNQQMYRMKTSDNSIVPFQGLTRSGSIARGVRVGNAQDPVLNSTLDLQLSGEIGEGTTLKASITDNNLPVQGDGASRQVREFDRVFIEIENDKFGTITAGDYNIEGNNNDFLQFNKRISGGGIKTTQNLNDNGTKIHAEANGALARGKFARNTFRAEEGNQGPYKLFGNDDESFIIIISGSERVYIDGELMERGEDNDYIIDYNTAELKFTALQPITKDRRIAIEFQYVEQNYLRSVFYGEAAVEDEKWNVKFSLFSEQDAPNQSLFQTLSDEQKSALADIGPNIENAVFPSFTETEFSPERVLYRLTDSLGFDSIFVYSIDPNERLFAVNFTQVGPNNGDYVLDQNMANGRVFRWVPPENGVPQGNFAPVVRLVTPKQLQVATLQGNYKWNENNAVSLQMATSRNDLNRFAPDGADGNLGSALKFAYQNKSQWKKWTIESSAGLEWVESSFTTVERLRNIEFERDWNIIASDSADQWLGNISLNFSRKGYGRAGYALQFFDNGPYNGIRHNIFSDLRHKNSSLQIKASGLESSDAFGRSSFYRQKSNAYFGLSPVFGFGVRSEIESNLRRGTDEILQDGAYNFYDGTAYLRFGDSSVYFIEVFAFARTDDTVRTGEMQRNANAWGYGIKGETEIGRGGNLQMNVTDRRLKVLLPEESPWMQTVTGRARYNQRLLKNTITFTSFYEVGSGTEPRRIFSYIEVPPGTGTHVWNDYNGNGVQELDEFEPARFPGEANYIRIFTPTNEFVRTNLNKFSQMLLVNPASIWGNKKGWKKTMSKFSVQGTFTTDRRSLIDGNRNRLNPFYEPGEDTLILAMADNFRGSLFFNRSETRFGGDYTFQQNQGRNLLSFGVEVNQTEEHQINLRMRIPKEVLSRLKLKTGQRTNRSDNFESRNFAYQYYGYTPEITYQPTARLRVTGEFDWQSKNAPEELQTSVLQRNAGIEGNYNIAGKSSMTLRFNYIINDFEGNVNSPIAFEMLEGLRPGRNGVWAFSLQHTLGSGLQLSLTYEGRASEDIPTIHTGQVQVKAFF